MVKPAKPAASDQAPVEAGSEIPARGATPPIIGIGASAGGLEALEHFLANVPDGSGMAFVIIQHLDPTYKGMLPELLQRTTAMTVVQAANRMKVNAELQSKVDDLSSMNNDMKNLLNSTDIATVFLDGALNVRRFTTPATQLFKLIPGDIGRPLSDIVNDLCYPELQADAQAVLYSLFFSEKQIATRDGRWFKVRIMPYRTLENVIDGVVITFSDITEAKTLEAELRNTHYSAPAFGTETGAKT